MCKKKVIIIGAGLAGLSTGCYLQMNGFDTEIFEAHNQPGGCITSWKRKNYLIDGSIHGLVGSSPSHPMYKIWNEIVDMNELQFYDSPVIRGIICKNGKTFFEYSNLDKLQEYMEEISPEDKKVIGNFINAIRKLQKYKMFDMIAKKPMEFFRFIDYLKMLKLLPALSLMKKWQKTTAHEFSSKFKNPFLKEAVGSFDDPILFEMLVLSEMDQKRSGYPLGGSLNFSKKIEERYLELGGIIHYNSRVSKINTQSDPETHVDKAIGITLESGVQYTADLIISAADGYTTLFNMLQGKYLTKNLRKLYDEKDLNTSRFLAFIGINKTLNNFPAHMRINLEKPYELADGSKHKHLDIRLFHIDPSSAPEGKTLMEISLKTKNFDFWSDLRKKDRKGYRELKNKICNELIEIVSHRIDAIKNSIDMVDISTPATIFRYTSNWQGSIQGWANENLFKMKKVEKELPNLCNFFMVGHWVQPGGGVPMVFLSGRTLVQIICKRAKKPFKTHK
ncbi:MAG: NAD(P)/FAD-dependent oxidoreductase [Asgard group archaeon]|nr:NAD(P)/FAD-dependent oxidoreductase [Asgard group archaeon]